jgi:hypothetical protein
MTTTIEQNRKTFGDTPIVTVVMLRESFDRYRDASSAEHQADLDAMVGAGTLVVKESSG